MGLRDKSFRILVVDDNEELRIGYSRLLTNHGYEVDVAPSGLIARNLYESCPYDLVITDILMPGVDGLSLIMQLRVFDKGVRIIAISGGGKTSKMGYLKLAKSFGAFEAIQKPITNEELLEVVKNVLKSG